MTATYPGLALELLLCDFIIDWCVWHLDVQHSNLLLGKFLVGPESADLAHNCTILLVEWSIASAVREDATIVMELVGDIKQDRVHPTLYSHLRNRMTSLDRTFGK